MSSGDAEWLGRVQEKYVAGSIRVRRPTRPEVPIIGRNGGGQQDRTAPQCRSSSLIGIKQPAANDVYG
jgi:hypothetical protein